MSSDSVFQERDIGFHCGPCAKDQLEPSYRLAHNVKRVIVGRVTMDRETGTIYSQFYESVPRNYDFTI